jgi:recombinational DNA repair protein RecT
MAKKTAIRRVSKLVPFSPEVAGIIDDSEMREFKQMRNATPKANLREIPLNPFIKNETEGDDQ